MFLPGLMPLRAVPEAAVTADKTVMCLTRKQDLYTGSGPDHCGQLYFDNLGCEIRSIYHANNI